MTRGPTLPRVKGAFLPILLVFALTRASALASFAPEDRLGPDGRLIVYVSVLASFVIGTLAWPMLVPFAERLRHPRLRNWIVTWGTFVLTSWTASMLLKHWLQVLLGPDLVLSYLWVEPMQSILSCLVLSEVIHGQADRSAERIGEARRLIDRILTTHEIVRGAKEAEGLKLRKFLVSRVELALRELRQEVASLREPSVGESERLITLRDRIDTLREQDLREASHLLHPHLPKAGIAPALASLARRLGGRLLITVECADEVKETVSALPAPVCHAAYCLVEASLERAVGACGAHSAAVRVGAGSGGQLSLAIDHDCCGCFDAVADSCFDLAVARLELAGGAVSAARMDDVARITMTLPVAEGSDSSLVPWGVAGR